jgi:hypothetical protein
MDFGARREKKVALVPCIRTAIAVLPGKASQNLNSGLFYAFHSREKDLRSQMG